VQYKWYAVRRRADGCQVSASGRLSKTLASASAWTRFHPHAFRHACGIELLKRSGGNLRAVQEHLRHADIQTTTIYTRLAPQDLQKVVNLFDERNGGAHTRVSIPSYPGRKSFAETFNEIGMVAPTGSDRAWGFVIERFVAL
jgi:hypothetical protein